MSNEEELYISNGDDFCHNHTHIGYNDCSSNTVEARAVSMF